MTTLNEVQTMNLNDITTLADAASERRQHVFVGHNLGNGTLMLSVKLHEFYEMSAVSNDPTMGDVSQRPLDAKHSRGLAIYILKGLVSSALKKKGLSPEAREALEEVQENLGTQVYMCLQPIVANLRLDGGRPPPRLDPIMDAKTGAQVAVAVFLRTDDILWVIDGQHRREAMHEVFEFLQHLQRTRRYPKKSLYEADHVELSPTEMQAWEACIKEARGSCTVVVEVHVGLNTGQERQLFHDLNSKVKPVQASLSFDFDSANPIIGFIKLELPGFGIRIVPDTDKVDFDDEDNGGFSMKELVAVNAHVFLNKTNVKGVTQGLFNERLELARDFWKTVAKIPDFGNKNAKHLTVAAQSVVLKALAKLSFDFSEFGRGTDNKALTQLLKSIPTSVDFTHKNPMWRYFGMSEAERLKHGLAGLTAYLPKSDGNRDVGGFDETTGWMRFGAKHNDIFPIIGDMIRWKLNLPNRNEPSPPGPTGED